MNNLDFLKQNEWAEPEALERAIHDALDQTGGDSSPAEDMLAAIRLISVYSDICANVGCASCPLAGTGCGRAEYIPADEVRVAYKAAKQHFLRLMADREAGISRRM
ncbi:MAG: hypothetical protein Alpg2KO_02660 [Alphaproteobacteria bacterium]